MVPGDSTRGSASGESSLRRELGVALSALVVVNATIGTGIFKKPAQTARLVGSMGEVLAVWALGGAVALCGALSMAELAASMPRAGGLYEYLRRQWGPRPAFLLGWARLALLVPSATGSFARLGAEALTSTLGLAPDPRRETAVAVAILAGCGAANVVGVRASASAQAAVTAVKYLGVLGLALAGLALGGHAPAAPLAPATSPGGAAVFTALVGVMWAYDGWADLASLSAEVREPAKTLPRALALGTLAVCGVYLAAVGGYARALGLEGLRASTTGADMAAARLAQATLGAPGRAALSALVLVSCVGACMSSLLTGPRVFVPMATDGVAPAWLGAVSPRTGAPARAVLTCTALGCAYVCVRSFEQLTDAFVVGIFPFYALAVAGVVAMRRREPSLPRPFRVPGYPWVPGVFLAGAAAVIAGAVMDTDRNGLFALGVLALGIPLERWLRRA